MILLFLFTKTENSVTPKFLGIRKKKFKEKNEKINNPGVGIYFFQSVFDKKIDVNITSSSKHITKTL